MEHLIVVFNCTIQKIPTGLIQLTGIFTIFFIQNAVCLCFIGTVAENRCDTKLLRRVFCHLPLKLLVVQLCHLSRSDAKNSIKTVYTPFLFHLPNRSVRSRSNLSDVGKHSKLIAFFIPVGLLIKVFQDVFRHQRNSFRCHERFLPIDVPYFFIINVRIRVHGFDIVHPKRQHVLIVNGIDDGVSVKLIAERLFCCAKLWIFRRSGVCGKDWRSGEPK